MSSDSFENVIYKMCLEIIYLIYVYMKDLALNSWYAIKPNQTLTKKKKKHERITSETRWSNWIRKIQKQISKKTDEKIEENSKFDLTTENE